MSRSPFCRLLLRRPRRPQRGRRPCHRRRAVTESVPGAVATGSSPDSDIPNEDSEHWRNCVTRIERRAVTNSWLEAMLIEYFKLSLALLTRVCLVAKLKVIFNLKELEKSMCSQRARMWLGLIAALGLLSLGSACGNKTATDESGGGDKSGKAYT